MKRSEIHREAMPNPSSLGIDLNILLSGTDEVNRWRNANPGMALDLRDVEVEDRDLAGALLNNVDLSGATFRRCNLVGACFDDAILAHTQFCQCDLSRSTVRSTDLTRTKLIKCILDNTDFSDSRGFSQITSITSCKINDRGADVTFDITQCRLLDRFLSWDSIRAVGQLRLFVPSYAGLLITIFFLLSVAVLNVYLEVARDLVASLTHKNFLSGDLGGKIVLVLGPWEPSWRHFATLFSFFGVAVGSTLYLFCPSRVREFTLDHWKYIAERPSFEYLVQTWASPQVRICCVTSYGLGGAAAAALIVDTFIRAVTLISRGLN